MDYYLFDPSGNITALIPVSDPSDCRQETADCVMEMEPDCEQVGFVLPGTRGCLARLQMAGGEFCGNASLCTAVLQALQNGTDPDGRLTAALQVSGTDKPVDVMVQRLDGPSGYLSDEENFSVCFTGSIRMPIIKDIHPVMFPQGSFPVVFVPGISHVIVPESFGIEQAEGCIRSWCTRLRANGLGIMLTDEDMTRITPLVYVAASKTLFREHSCASGTSAVGAWLARSNGTAVTCSFTEPGGTLAVTASPDGKVTLQNTIKLVRHVCKD